MLGLSPEEAEKMPYIASMGIYVFKKDVLLKLLRYNTVVPTLQETANLINDVGIYSFSENCNCNYVKLTKRPTVPLT